MQEELLLLLGGEASACETEIRQVIVERKAAVQAEIAMLLRRWLYDMLLCARRICSIFRLSAQLQAATLLQLIICIDRGHCL